MLKLLAGAIGGYGDRDGTGPTARFNNPTGVASDGAGNIFVADSWNHTIRKVVIATGAVTTLAGSPENGAAPTARDLTHVSTIRRAWRATARATSSSLTQTTTPYERSSSPRESSPPWLAPQETGATPTAPDLTHVLAIRQLWRATARATSSSLTQRTARYERSSSPQESSPPWLAPRNWGNTDGTGPDARFGHLSGVASDGAGYLFVTDPENCTIRKILIATAAVTTLAGSPGNRGKTDGTGPDARFCHPSGVASDGAGNLSSTTQRTVRYERSSSPQQPSPPSQAPQETGARPTARDLTHVSAVRRAW